MIKTAQEWLALPEAERVYELRKVLPGLQKIDWNTAMEWFRKTEGAIDCLFKLWQRYFDEAGKVESWGDWLANVAQPYHYLVAAAMAAEKETK